MRRGLWVVCCAVVLAPGVCAVALALVGCAAPREVAAATTGAAVRPLYDRGYKCDLVERLPEPPELVIFGGSRAQRFEPTLAEELTGLPAFNFAVQNSRPEDVYAMARHLFWRAPGVKLRCFWALQATTLSDAPLHPGLLAERRLSRFLPEYLLAEQRTIPVSGQGRELSPDNRFAARGNLVHNSYDARVERGVPFERTLAGYLASLVPRAGAPASYDSARARKYFERTLQLFNLHDVEPVLVIMPYHPTALAAFRAVGWGAKEKALKTYLKSLRGAYRFHLLDYTDIESFRGSRDAFYDGAHVTAANARRILAQAVEDAPAGFR
ncbi:MAG: hypothetical protein ACM3MJ_02410 [Deltaproteobacteria bacterium]